MKRRKAYRPVPDWYVDEGWEEAGFDFEEAEAWRDVGVDSEEALELYDEGLEPEEAKEWLKRFPVEEIIDWLGFTDDPEEAENWKEVGVEPEDAKRWEAIDLPPENYYEIANQVGYDEDIEIWWVEYMDRGKTGDIDLIRDWYDLGVDASDARLLEDNGYYPEDVEGLTYEDIELRDIVRCAEEGLTPRECLEEYKGEEKE